MSTLKAGFGKVINWLPLRRGIEYLKNVASDYKGSALDIVKDSRDAPLKATIYGSGLALLAVAYKTNPDETSFHEQLIETYTDMGLIVDDLRRPSSYKHVIEVNKFDSQRVLKRINFAFFSAIVRLDHDPVCGIYVSQCAYLKPSYFDYIRERVVDIGIFGRWRILDAKLQDYDVNPSEWNEEDN